MATRRPKVPSAQFTAGPQNAPPSPMPEEPLLADTAAKTKGGKKGSAARTHRSRVTADPAPANAARAKGERGRDEGIIHHDSTPVPARTFNGRLLVLGLAMAAITVMLAPNVHTYMSQRAEISAIRQDIAAQQSKQSTYQAELARWDDPAYVKQQARDRVSMLMPGETGYWVYGANGAQIIAGQPAESAPSTSAKEAVNVPEVPWVDGLWDAIKKSAEVTPAPAPAPVPAPAPEEAPAP